MMFGLSCPSPPGIDVEVNEGDVIKLGEVDIEVLETPGHSPGHVCYYIKSESCVISGDLIFEGSIGRTDFPGCNVDDMENSLRRIINLPEETLIFPGHMGVTSIGRELRSNPFLR
jgi:glyoxylase-like metal-dependent hydrolase (beta-lactamase superfamily II)